jgi:hypothetical protein
MVTGDFGEGRRREKDPHRFEPVAVRWLGRHALESRGRDGTAPAAARRAVGRSPRAIRECVAAIWLGLEV